jgi:hypothetical protein
MNMWFNMHLPTKDSVFLPSFLLALVGLALTYIKIQKKKKCFSVQYNDMVSVWDNSGLQLCELGWFYHFTE